MGWYNFPGEDKSESETNRREREKRETERLSNGYQNLLKIGDKDCQGIITIIIAYKRIQKLTTIFTNAEFVNHIFIFLEII